MTRAYVHTGDCLEAMTALDACSVDAVITDPPYGLAFMGKTWDHAVPGPPYWVEAMRVAKPGAHLLAFGGTRTYHRLTVAIEDAGWEIRDCMMWLYGTGFPKSHNGAHGGTALKPGWEPIIVARKKLDGTVAANFAKWGTGGVDVDAGRVGSASTIRPLGSVSIWGLDAGGKFGGSASGRWPANVILDEEAGALLDEQSGTLTSGLMKAGTQREEIGYSGGMGTVVRNDTIGDTGGASRFFYCAKASRKERGEGNAHPTVKPLSLMRYLVKLFAPRGGLVLDPFAGSGSTGVAALEEGRRFLGIERDPDHAETARRRLK